MSNKIKVFLFSLMIFSSYSHCTIDYFYLKDSGKEKVKITLKDLMSMPTASFITLTNFTPRDIFLGVSFKDIVQKYKIQGTILRAFAWDDYSYTMTINELVINNAILAYQRNGENMDVESLGPFAIVFPRDQLPNLNKYEIDAKTVWQIKYLEIKNK